MLHLKCLFSIFYESWLFVPVCEASDTGYPSQKILGCPKKIQVKYIEPWLLPVVLFTTRIFSPNISQLKCSTGRRNVREIKTKCSQKYRDKSSTKTSQPACQLVLKIIKEWKMFQQQPGKYFSCWENISQSLKHFIWK